MGTPSRFNNGVTNVGKNHFAANFKAMVPTKYHQYFNDFDTYVAGDWTVTAVGAGTQALTDGDGGLLLRTNAAADNDRI